jgi:hypothetical protein
MRDNFSKQYLHPNWQKRRLEMLELARWQCQDCGSKDHQLHVHHKRYVKGRMIWEYPDDELAVLCADCHGSAHIQKTAISDLLATLEPYQWHCAFSLLHGFFGHEPSENSVDAHAEEAGFVADACVSCLDISQITELRKKILSGGLNLVSPARQKKTDTHRAALEFLSSNGVDDDVVAQWLAVRKVKRLALTVKAVEAVAKGAEKAGLSLPDAIALCAERSWGGFQAEWLSGKPGANGGNGLALGNIATAQRVKEKLFGGNGNG